MLGLSLISILVMRRKNSIGELGYGLVWERGWEDGTNYQRDGEEAKLIEADGRIALPRSRPESFLFNFFFFFFPFVSCSGLV